MGSARQAAALTLEVLQRVACIAWREAQGREAPRMHASGQLGHQQQRGRQSYAARAGR